MSIDKVLVLLGGLAAILWVNWYFFLARRAVGSAATTASGVQEIRITVAGGYTPQVVRVKAGRPVRLIFDRRETNPCSEEIVIPDFSIRRFLPPGQPTAVEFTPARPGEHQLTCGMGMLHGTVIVE
ncbi:MAG TPA: cupredoxin domain-containing protein [Gemmatimonadales bacterium]|nr:cupredoxin domain-containing protein [Gemmatimonadales bacterium]